MDPDQAWFSRTDVALMSGETAPSGDLAIWRKATKAKLVLKVASEWTEWKQYNYDIVCVCVLGGGGGGGLLINIMKRFFMLFKQGLIRKYCSVWILSSQSVNVRPGELYKTYAAITGNTMHSSSYTRSYLVKPGVFFILKRCIPDFFLTISAYKLLTWITYLRQYWHTL